MEHLGLLDSIYLQEEHGLKRLRKTQSWGMLVYQLGGKTGKKTLRKLEAWTKVTRHDSTTTTKKLIHIINTLWRKHRP